jgi:hypothetical protein
MPKEITHWLIAERAASSLTGSLLEKDVAANPHCLHFGAVFPDVLYFLVGKKPAARLSSLAHALHGAGGEDTYAFLRSLLAVPVAAAESGPMAAFWVGVAAHLRTDITFHPFVYYLSGDYDHADPGVRTMAIQRHRRFETVMDMYFNRDGTGRQVRRHSLRAILAGLEMPLPRLLEIASQAMAAIFKEDPAEIEGAHRKALGTFVTLQDLSCRLLLGRILFTVEKLLPRTAREVAAVFQAPQLTARFRSLSEPTPYLNPVTGKAGVTTVDALFMQAVRDCADFWRKTERAVIERSPEAIQDRGPSLSFGLPGATARDARFFAPLTAERDREDSPGKSR